MKLIGTMALAGLLAIQAPLPAKAAAEEPDADRAYHLKNPWLASSLGLPSVVGLMLVSPTLPQPILTALPFQPLIYLAPAGLAAGHLYAEDFERAAWIAVLAPVACTAVSLVGTMVDASRVTPCGPAGPCGGQTPPVMGAVYGFAFTGLAIGAWAGWDAYRTVLKKNSELETRD